MSTRRASRHARANQRAELMARTLTAIPAALLAAFLVVEGGAIFAVGVFAVGWIGMHELFSMYRRARPVDLAGLITLGALILAALYGGRTQVLLVTVAALPVLFALTMFQRRPSAGGMALTLLGIYWIGLALAHAVLLRRTPHGGGVVFDVLLAALLGDTGAYIGGHLFGEHQMAPRISPGKTLEGLLIGMICAIAGVWLASRFQEWLPANHALLLGAGVALVGPLGDLFESFIKREAHIKDSGTVFGPHGGVLDRLDAVMFAVVTGYYIWSAYL
ncbi:MAG: phosphatidate cytidylyltransferase [Acidobacteriota bacterium]|nr:phosphatidate cytidylyltransferase [Acidobacteriota bacterium]